MSLQSAASTYLVTFEMRNSAEWCQSEHFKHSSDIRRLQDSASNPTKNLSGIEVRAGTIATRRQGRHEIATPAGKHRNVNVTPRLP